MNSYLITAMPGTPRTPRVGLDEVRYTVLTSAILFYEELCSELTWFIHEFAWRWFSDEGLHIMRTFTVHP